jgi:hypothetical protein
MFRDGFELWNLSSFTEGRLVGYARFGASYRRRVPGAGEERTFWLGGTRRSTWPLGALAHSGIKTSRSSGGQVELANPSPLRVPETEASFPGRVRWRGSPCAWGYQVQIWAGEPQRPSKRDWCQRQHVCLPNRSCGFESCIAHVGVGLVETPCSPTPAPRAFSSTEEQLFHTQRVGGSNPSRPTGSSARCDWQLDTTV